MKMSYILYAYSALLSLSLSVFADPVMQSIQNDTDFGFAVINHSDASECSLGNKQVVIPARSEFSHQFLLPTNNTNARNNMDSACLVLRPAYYQDPTTNKQYELTDENFDNKPMMAHTAFEAYRGQPNSCRCKNDSEYWLKHFVGEDIFVMTHLTEMLGYLKDSARIAVVNSRSKHTEWLSYSMGIFSKLVLKLRIFQTSRGIKMRLIVLHGEGGVCSNGAIDLL